MEHYQFKMKDKIKLKRHKVTRLIRGDLEKPDGVKIVWHIDGGKEIIKPKFQK